MLEISGDTKLLLTGAIRKRDELNTFIKVLQEMLGADSAVQDDETAAGSGADTSQGAGSEVKDPLAAVYAGQFFGQTQPAATVMLLKHVRKPLKTRIILDCLKKGGLEVGGKNPSINLWGTLNRNKKKFVLVPKAGWALREWYDEKSLAKMGKSDRDDNENSDDLEEEKESAGG